MACKCYNSNIKEEDYKSFSDFFKACKCGCKSRLVVDENKRKFEIVGLTSAEATKLIEKIKVDGYLINSTINKKCDYLFLYHKNEKDVIHLFVELKGCDIITAIQQIKNTIIFLRSKQIINNQKMLGFIVPSRYPSNDGTYRKEKTKIEREYKIKIEQKNTYLKYNPKTSQVS